MTDHQMRENDTTVVNWIQEYSPAVAFNGSRCVLEWWVKEQHYRAEGVNLRDAVRQAIRYDPPPESPEERRRIDAIDPDGIGAIRAMLHGEGELLDDDTIYKAWEAFSAAESASWLIVDHFTVGNFAGWLLTERVRLLKAAAHV